LSGAKVADGHHFPASESLETIWKKMTPTDAETGTPDLRSKVYSLICSAQNEKGGNSLGWGRRHQKRGDSSYRVRQTQYKPMPMPRSGGGGGNHELGGSLERLPRPHKEGENGQVPKKSLWSGVQKVPPRWDRRPGVGSGGQTVTSDAIPRRCLLTPCCKAHGRIKNRPSQSEIQEKKTNSTNIQGGGDVSSVESPPSTEKFFPPKILYWSPVGRSKKKNHTGLRGRSPPQGNKGRQGGGGDS